MLAVSGVMRHGLWRHSRQKLSNIFMKYYRSSKGFVVSRLGLSVTLLFGQCSAMIEET